MRNPFSEPISISESFSLPSRVILSPMEGIMNRNFFFDAARSLGLIDSWMPPFLGVPRGAAPSFKALKRHLGHYFDSGIPLTVQLLGNDADSLAETALRLWEYGVRSVNLNFACPSKTVLGSGSGGALLREPDCAAEIVGAIRKRVPPLCLSVKLRSGFSSPGETEGLVRRICDSGISWLLFHFRTVSENYAAVNGKEALQRIRSAVHAAGAVPVFGNGDIQTAADARRMRDESGCAGVAVGRGFLKNPFLLREIRGAEPDSRMRKSFLDELLRRAKDASGRVKYDFYIECIKMAYGTDSGEFLRAIRERAEFYSSKNVFPG